MLVDTLARQRLVNRSNLGISRMFESLLIEGKEPPFILETGELVTLTFRRHEFASDFRIFAAEENQEGRSFSVDHLLVLQYLLAHPEMDTLTAARLCQRPEPQARDVLTHMEQGMEYLERGGTGRGTYWTLRPEIHRRLAGPGHPERDRRIDWEAAKTRILSILMDRARRGEPGLSNQEIRQVTHFDRNQARRVMQELIKENPQIRQQGERRWARYAYFI